MTILSLSRESILRKAFRNRGPRPDQPSKSPTTNHQLTIISGNTYIYMYNYDVYTCTWCAYI